MQKLMIGITAPQSIDLIAGQLKFFSDKGYDVYLLAPGTDKVAEFCRQEGATLLPIDIKRDISPIQDFKILLKILTILRKVRPDIVNFGTPKVSLLGLTAARMAGIKKRIYTCRGFRYEHEQGKFKKFLIALEKVTASSAHKVICISKSVEDLGVKDGVFSRSKTHHIAKGSSNGLDLSLFDPNKVDMAAVQAFKDEKGLSGKFVFGYVGRLVDRKGIKEMYEAFSALYNEDNSCRLLVIGRPYPDQIKDNTVIKNLNSHPGIIMMGLQPLESIPFYLSAMDTFVLPAWWEGFGNVLIQAAAMGLPIISTNVTGCKDAVSDGYNGVLLPAHNVPALKETMQYFMNNKDKVAVYGQKGKEWALNFKPQIIWEGLDKLYKSNF